VLLKGVKEGIEDIMLSVEKVLVGKISTADSLAFIFGVNVNSMFIVGMFLSKVKQFKRMY